jgi:sugar lactone lactonase YvrE
MVEVLLNNYFGRQFNSLNDVAINPRNDDIYFTDTLYGTSWPKLSCAISGTQTNTAQDIFKTFGRLQVSETRCIVTTIKRGR